MNPKDLARIQRNRLRIRQTIIYGVLTAIVTIVGFGAWAMWTGKMEPLFDTPLAHETEVAVDYGPVPCPEGADAVYPRAGTVEINALNGSSLRGAARAAGETMTSRGFGLGKMDNANFQYTGEALIRTGEKGVNNAYLVAAHAGENAVITVDDRLDATVDLIVGEKWQGLIPSDTVEVKAGQRIPRPAECTEISQIIASLAADSTSPSPSTTP